MSSIYKSLSEEDPKLARIAELGKNIQQQNAVTSPAVKVAIIFAFILSLGALGAAAFLFTSFQGERKVRENLEASQAQLAQKADSYEKSASQYRSEIARITEQLKSYGEEKQQFKKQIDTANAQIAALSGDIKKIQDRGKAMEEQAAKYLEKQAQSDAPALGPATQTGTVNSAPPAPEVPQAPQVLTVNRKFNFVVVNLGLAQKMKIGDLIDVQRGGKTVANLQVEKLYESFSAAAIVREPKDAPIVEGDTVRKAG